jgi:hypothetical protein
VPASFESTQRRSRSSKRPTAIARTSVVGIWLPTLPPVPSRSGTKKASATTCSSSSSKWRITVPVYASARNSAISQKIRLRNSSGMLAWR